MSVIQKRKAITNINKEHEMKKKNYNCSKSSPVNIQNSTDTHGFKKQAPEGAFKTTIKGILIHANDNTGCICVNQSRKQTYDKVIQCVYYKTIA